MAKQKSPHTQSDQNRTPEQADFERDEPEYEGNSPDDLQTYTRNAGAETGGTRSSRRSQSDGPQHNTEPETVAHEGRVHSRTPKRFSQGITSHSADEESERQKKVVNQRPDAQAGVNHSK